MKLQLELRAAAHAAEDTARRDAAAGRRGRTPRGSHRTTVHQGSDERRRVHTAHVGCHFGFAPEEAPAVAGRRIRDWRRVLIIRQRTCIASVDPALLAVLHREVHLYRYSGVKGVPAQGAAIEMMSVHIQQVLLKLLRMRIQLLARVTRVLLANLAQIMFGQVNQHVLAIWEDDLALGTRMLPAGGLLSAMIGLQMPRQMFAERLKILQRGAALAAQQRTSGVTASDAVSGVSGRVLVREIGRFRRVSAARRSGIPHGAVVNAVQLRLPVIYRRCRSAILTVLKNIMLGVGGRRGARDTAQRAHHHCCAKSVEAVYREKMIAQAGQRGELHGALIAGERILVVIPFAGSLVSIFGVLPIRSRLFRAVLVVQQLVAWTESRLLLVQRSTRRRRSRQALRAAQDRLVHRVHMHLELLHATERVPSAIHAGKLQGRAENGRGGSAAGTLRRL